MGRFDGAIREGVLADMLASQATVKPDGLVFCHVRGCRGELPRIIPNKVPVVDGIGPDEEEASRLVADQTWTFDVEAWHQEPDGWHPGRATRQRRNRRQGELEAQTRTLEKVSRAGQTALVWEIRRPHLRLPARFWCPRGHSNWVTVDTLRQGVLNSA